MSRAWIAPIVCLAVVLPCVGGGERVSAQTRPNPEGGLDLSAVAWSLTGDVLATGNERGNVQLLAGDDGRRLATFRAHDARIRELAFMPDGAQEWPSSAKVFLPHAGEKREGPAAGEIFRQADLEATLRKLVEAERAALASGKGRKDAIYAAYDRFYKGDIAQEYARGAQDLGGLITADDLATWKVKLEEPVMTDYKGIQVYKLTVWTQGPAMLQALNMLEEMDLKAMGFNSAKYIHTIYQVMTSRLRTATSITAIRRFRRRSR